MTPDKITCEEFFRRLDDYLDRRLQPWELAALDVHLQTCELCLKEYDFELGVIRKVSTRIKEIQAPPYLFNRISKALRSQADLES